MLLKLTDRKYTVLECHDHCLQNGRCAGFILGNYGQRTAGVCELYREGCTVRLDRNWSYYAMADCKNAALAYTNQIQPRG